MTCKHCGKKVACNNALWTHIVYKHPDKTDEGLQENSNRSSENFENKNPNTKAENDVKSTENIKDVNDAILELCFERETNALLEERILFLENILKLLHPNEGQKKNSSDIGAQFGAPIQEIKTDLSQSGRRSGSKGRSYGITEGIPYPSEGRISKYEGRLRSSNLQAKKIRV